jgi:negative regulator of sigma E activity
MALPEHKRIATALRRITLGLATAIMAVTPVTRCEAQATQRPFALGRPGARRVFRPAVEQERTRRAAETKRAREVMMLFLRQGQRQPYLAEQTTRLQAVGAPVRESQLVIKRGGPGRERMEFLSPAGMRGEVILLNNGRLFNYKPGVNKIFEGVAPLEVFQHRAKQLMEDMQQGRIAVRVMGTEIIAGQEASIVEMRGGNGGKRFWIDNKTGVRLRTDELNAEGSVIQTSYFTKVDYAPSFEAKEFSPASLPNVPHEPRFPAQPPLPDVETAQQQVNYPIRQPDLPEGFRLSGVWVADGLGGRKIVILRYTDGVTNFALFQQPIAPKPGMPPFSNGKPRMQRRNSVVHWAAGDRLYTLVGNVRLDTARQVVESVK